MSIYKSKPYYVEGMQWSGDIYINQPPWFDRLLRLGLVFMFTKKDLQDLGLSHESPGMFIKRKDGKHTKVYPGDYVYVRGGIVHRSNKDTFESGYEEVKEYPAHERDVTMAEIVNWQPAWKGTKPVTPEQETQDGVDEEEDGPSQTQDFNPERDY